jgi:hypothetical protein
MKKIYKINSRLVKLPNAEQKQKGNMALEGRATNHSIFWWILLS